ncbi:MAG TPA: hypothetical protein VHC63_14935 [Acidimicrobiales bacterium]|nr:hypothetical protein [Acidimicrobiales bacterium]
MKRKLSVIAAASVAFAATGVAFAAWTASGAGSGYTKARTAQALSTVDVSATTTAQLYPGGSGDVLVRIANPNPYDVVVTGIAQTASASISSGNATCDNSNSVTYSDQTGTWTVPAGGESTVTLTGAAAMSTASVDACQGLVFTIPVTLSGHSAP